MNTFGMDHRYAVPLLYRNDFKQGNYYVITSQDNKIAAGSWGFVYAEGLLNNPSWTICPSMTLGSFVDLADAPQEAIAGQAGSNQWPPVTSATREKRYTRSTYGVRPLDSYRGDAGLDPTTATMHPLQELNGQVLISDVLSIPTYLNASHVDGVNAARGDGAARWVPRDQLPTLDTIIDGAFTNAGNDAMLTDDGTAGLFVEMDQAF
jgi:hypothetical protein